jgi:DNA-binding ferritin-like protein
MSGAITTRLGALSPKISDGHVCTGRSGIATRMRCACHRKDCWNHQEVLLHVLARAGLSHVDQLSNPEQDRERSGRCLPADRGLPVRDVIQRVWHTRTTSHWQTYGPLFRDLHLLFDEFAKDVLESVDHLAERVRMIGQDPPAPLTEMLDLASVSVAAPHSTLQDMIEEADRNALIVIKEMRQAARVANEHDDPGTVDLLSTLAPNPREVGVVAPGYPPQTGWS